MAAKVIKGKKAKTAVKKVAVKKKATSMRRAKKSRATSVVVLILSGSTALRRRKSAETLAESLHVDLFRVDVSAVVSQYIGETEKNLNDVFDKAEGSGAGTALAVLEMGARLHEALLKLGESPGESHP